MPPVLTDSVLYLGGQFLLGLVILVFSGNWLVRSASRLAGILGMSPTVIGLTIVAFGTSLPELLVSLIANLSPGYEGTIAIGNVVGSNITNISLIMGLGAVIAVLPMERIMLQREYPYMLLMSLLLIGFSLDGQIVRLEGTILVLGLAFFMYYNYRTGRNTEVVEQDPETSGRRPVGQNLVILAFSIAGLALGAQWLVDGASGLAARAGVSELFIGLSVVALGTSLPELATTIAAIRHGERDIAVGNLVGSNVFNILAIVGITATIKPLTAPTTMLGFDYPVMFLTSLLPFAIAWFTQYRAGKIIGIPLLLLYVAYYTTLYLDATGALPWLQLANPLA